MKYIPEYILFLLLVGAGSANLFAQYQEPTVSKLGKFVPPKSAKTLEGRILVVLSVGADGRVTSVDSIDGPGYICPQVTRPDVVAAREAAKRAAWSTIFVPASAVGSTSPSKATLEFYLPARKRADEGKVENYATAPGQGEKYTIAGPGTGDGGTAPKTLTGGVLENTSMSLPKPPYPAAARAVRASGDVQVRLLIDEEGAVFSAEPVSGHPLLRSASSIAACKAKFQPTLLSGQPVKISGIVTYKFVP